MATLAANNPTLLDVAKTMDPDGSASAVAELLSQENEVLMDMPWFEGNLPTGHRVSMRTGLPSSTWRKFNAGIAQSKSTYVQVDEDCGMLEQMGTVDRALAELNGNTVAFRMLENRGHIEGMNNDFSTALFYASTSTEPEKFMGFAPRFNSLSAENADNIISASGASSDNCSIWLVGWGAQSCHGIFPKGTKAGLEHTDLGIETVYDSNSNPFRAYRDHYVWKCGLALKDWRYVVRICNIDVSDLTKNASAGADLIDLMTRATERIHSLNGVRPVFYVNRTVRSFLRRQVVNKIAGATLTYDAVGGQRILSFAEIPVRRCDALTNAEAAVS